MKTNSLVTVALLMLISLSTGCSMFTKEKGSKKGSTWESMKFWKKEYQTPTKMAVMWSHDLLTVAGQPPTRGFGGRIYFYNDKSQTIPVEGELVVHGFDEAHKKLPGADQNLPDKRFRFTAEQFTEHFSESDLGASYSVWIPWDTNDNTLKELTLIPTFVSSKGQMVQGAPAKVILPGRMPSQPNITIPVQTVAYEQSTIPTVEGKLPVLKAPSAAVPPTNQPPVAPGQEPGDMRVTTIKLPAAFNRGKPTATTAVPASANPNANPSMPAPTSSVAPYVNAQIENMRAEAVANAFRPMQQPTHNAPTAAGMTANGANWSPNNLPTPTMRAVGLNQVTPPNYMPTNQSAPQMATGAAQPVAPNNTMTNSAMPGSLNNNQPYRGDNYPGGLPPGFEFSPPATAW